MKVVEKIKIHVLRVIPLFFENSAVYEIMWKNVRARNATDDNIIWNMRFACRITKAIIQTQTQNT